MRLMMSITFQYLLLISILISIFFIFSGQGTPRDRTITPFRALLPRATRALSTLAQLKEGMSSRGAFIVFEGSFRGYVFAGFRSRAHSLGARCH